MANVETKQSEQRRGSEPAEEEYLARVGERLRTVRTRRGLSRKLLSVASGVSERYLAEMERGAGNASLLVVRRLALAMGIRVSDFTSEEPDRAVDFDQAVHLLERLPPAELAEARTWLAGRFGKPRPKSRGRVALIGLRGTGKSALGAALAKSEAVPFIELDREIERASGMELSELFAAHGQSGFRRFEYECLEQVVASYDRCVIATGSSLVTEPRTFELLLSECFVMALSAAASAHDHFPHLAFSERPSALSRQARGELETISAARAPLYAKANASIEIDPKDEAATFDRLRALVVERVWSRSA